MQSFSNNQNLSVALNIKAVNTEGSKYYVLESQWTDSDTWNPSLKGNSNSISVNPADLLLNVISVLELTFCKRILINVIEDEPLRENLKVITGQSESKTKSKALKEICFNAKEQTKLSSMFRANNIEVI